MRALGLVLVGLVSVALATGCGGEKKPSEEKNQDEALSVGSNPVPPKPVSAIAKIQKSELVAPVKAEDTAAAEDDTAKDAADTAAAAVDTASDTTAPGEIELTETEGIGLAELTVARAVENRKAIDSGQEFSLAEGNKLYAVMVVSNPDKVESEVTVAWQQGEGGKERGGVTVKVGAQPRWRTWAYHSHFKKPGRYYAIVRNAEGQVIGRAPFVVTE